MPKPVCVKCQTEFWPKTNGVLVIETASFGPYKVWSADLWKCPGCATEIVSGYSDHPIRQDHYAPDFPEWLEHEKSLSPRVIYNNERPTERETDG